MITHIVAVITYYFLCKLPRKSTLAHRTNRPIVKKTHLKCQKKKYWVYSRRPSKFHGGDFL
jgi:hypothetical protein